MSQFVDSEAEESEHEGDEDEDEIEQLNRKHKKDKRKKQIDSSDEEEDDDDEEVVKDLIDDNPIEEESDNDSDGSRKRKKSDDEDELNDRLEDEDYELLEENLGVKIKRKRFKKIRLEDEESDEETQDRGDDREAIATQLFEGSDNEEDVGRSRRDEPADQYVSDESDGEYSEPDDFIVDDDGRPITTHRRKRRPIYTDAALQEAQDIFGVDFDYAELTKEDEEEYDEEEDEDDYDEEDEEGDEQPRRRKKTLKGKRRVKSLYEVYEPHELERAGITEEDERIRKTDVPERMQLRPVPVVPAANEDELEEEAEWIYKNGFSGRVFQTAAEKKSAPAEDNWDTPSQMADDDWERASAMSHRPDGTEDWETQSVQSTRSARTEVGSQRGESAMEDDSWERESQMSRMPTGSTLSVRGNDDDQSGIGSRGHAAKSVISDRVDMDLGVKLRVISKIKKALEFMRNQQLEVPFIAFYRKEYIGPELKINDLWKIYRMDARYCQLRTRKARLCSLFKNMQEYQTDTVMNDPEAPVPEDIRIVSDDDIDRIRAIQRSEELKDMNLLFSLYYSDEIMEMKAAMSKKRREEKQRAREERIAEAAANGEELDEPMDNDLDMEETDVQTVKRKMGGGAYSMCKKLGLLELVRKFGLSADKYAENLRDNYQRHEVEQYPLDPIETANEHLNEKMTSPEEALRAAKYMLATQISREPVVRSTIREVFFERATISVRPTKKGIREIDESHPCFLMKYLKSKPIRELKDDEFLKLVIAEEDKLLTITIGDMIKAIKLDCITYTDELKQLFVKDEYTKLVDDWNQLRVEVIEFAVEKILYPVFRKELRSKLLDDAKEHITDVATQKLNECLKVAPYSVTFEEDDEDWDTSKGIRVLSIAYVPDTMQSSFAVVISEEGEPVQWVRLQGITKSTKSFNETDKEEKLRDLEKIRDLVFNRKPHVVVIGGESRDALMIRDDVKRILQELAEDKGFPTLHIEILDNELSKVYAKSLKAQADFRDYPLVLREAVSLGRRLQDPMVEFAQLVNHDDEILCLRFHPLQDHVSKDELLENLIMQFVNWTNAVGVDLNRCLSCPHTMNVAQFICGLGPRKATALIKTLKQNGHRLENRTQLITVCHMGPKIFINCSGFIKIDTNSLGDSTEAYVEILDGSRIHPETYEWARKMAVDALEEDDEGNPAGAIEEILETPEKLEELNLDAFAEELERQGFGNKSITLYDIRAELNHRYKDPRKEYVAPKPGEMFHMLTKETPETLYTGKLTTATVIGITHKKPQGDQLDNAIPVKNEQTGMWQCAFCMKSDFPDLSEVWNHFDAGACPGQAVGIRIRLDNGISGFIPIMKLSDNAVTNPDERVRRGQTIHCRITKIDVDRFSVDCTCRTSDLVDAKHELRPPKDVYYDDEQEAKDKQREDDIKKIKQRQTYVRRVIVHPSFKNISFKELIPMMEQMDQGEVVIRPSSKGHEHLTVTWKVTDGIYQHIDVREQNKENMFSLGKRLFIGSEEFEDLDEIIARYVNPMASHARDIVSYRYYMASHGGNKVKADEYLKEEKSKNPNKIHYVLHPSKDLPGKFVLSYLPGSKTHHEFITVTCEGFKYRQQTFQNLNQMLKWFKEHYKDPPPTIATPVATPKTHPARTPFAMTPGAHHDSSGKIVPPPPSHFPATSHTTPHYTTPAQAFTPYSAFTTHTPYTPSAQTPYLTPYQTPYQSGATPRASSNAQPGVFAHPGVSTTGYKSTTQKLGQSARPRAQGEQSEDNNTWRKAGEAWAKSLQRQPGWGTRHSRPSHDGGSSYNRYGGGQTAGPSQASRGQQIPAQTLKTIQQFMEGHSSALNFIPTRSPRSGRDSLKSTPRTNFSPRSMVESSLGDETPLHDEN